MEEEHNHAAKKQMVAHAGRSFVAGSLEDDRNSDQSVGSLSPPA